MSPKMHSLIVGTLVVIWFVAVAVLMAGCRGWQCQPYASATFTGAKAGVQCQQGAKPNREAKP